MDYKWNITMDTAATQDPSSSQVDKSPPRPLTSLGMVAKGDGLRPVTPDGSVVSEGVTYCPFIVEPESGRVPPGKQAPVTIKFSALDVAEYSGQLSCR